MNAPRDDRSPRERMLAGEPYISDDPEIRRDYLRAQSLTERFNASGAVVTRDVPARVLAVGVPARVVRQL